MRKSPSRTKKQSPECRPSGGGEMGELIRESVTDITERKLAEEVMGRLAAIIESSDDAIVSKDLNGVVTSWNKGAEKLFGYTAEEIIGKSITTIIPSDRLDEEERVLESIRRGEKIDHYETVRRRKDGGLIEISLTVSPVRDREGTVIGASKIARDISDRRRAEVFFRQYANQLALITNTAPVSIAHCDAQKRFKFVNQAYAQRFGLKPEDCIGKRIHDVLGAEVYENLRQYVDAVLRGEHVEFEIELPYAAIGNRFMHCSYAPEYDERGEVVGWVGAITDITERKRAELFLDAQKQSLEMVVRGAPLAEVLTYLTRIVERQADGQAVASILLLDERGCLHNGAAPSLPEDYLQAIDGLKIDPNLGACGAAAASCEVIVTPDIAADPKWQSLKELPLGLGLKAAWSNPITARDGRVLGTFGTYFRECREPSATERRTVEILSRTAAIAIERNRAEEEIARLLAEEKAAREVAEQAARAKDEFIGVVSHELRSPLNAILGWNDLLQSRQSDDPQIARVTDTIKRNGQTQLKLIEDLMDTTRIITGKMKLDVMPVELVDVVSSTLDAVRPAANNKGIVISSDVDHKAGQISGDPDRLRQVLWNLVSNAIKFTPEGGRVWVELRRGGAGAQIIVRDTGQGISPDLLPYVFDRFKQGDSSVSRRLGGLGLGLALVKSLVELHGGSVAVESPGAGQGATFTVNLPVRAVKWIGGADEQRGGDASVKPTARRGTVAARLEGLRALVVDDEDGARELLAATLEQYGVSVTGADSAEAALAALESQTDGDPPFDILISDIGMPCADGYDLLRRVRKSSDPRVNDIRAVALTAYARTDDRLRALRAGFHMHVPKPVDKEELIIVIASLTGRTSGRV